MKLQTLQVIQIFIECRNIVGGASVRVSKRSLFRLEITVGCRLCAYPNIRVCGVWYVWCEGGVCACVCVCVCVLKWLCVCVESVWDVRFVFWCCGALLCVLCVVCWVVCVGLCLWCGVVCVVSFSFFSFSSLSATMTTITRPVGSLCVHTALSCPKGQSAWTLAHSLLAEHVRIMQETTVLV